MNKSYDGYGPNAVHTVHTNKATGEMSCSTHQSCPIQAIVGTRRVRRPTTLYELDEVIELLRTMVKMNEYWIAELTRKLDGALYDSE